jgi:primary-amine oxidase
MRVNRISRARSRTAVGLSALALAAGATTAAGPAVAQP